MKAAVYYSQKDLRIEEKTVPKIDDDEILVEMRACGVCGSDLMGWYLNDRAPLVLGHEPTGIISKKGKEVRNFDVGERVFVHHHVSCLKCHYCLKGDFTLCKQFHETNITPGGFAEYFKAPALNLFDTLRIPDAMSFEEATLIEPVGCCLRALRKCNIQEGDSVAIIGSGTTGVIHTALSRILGAEKVIVSDLVDYRLRAARKSGATATANPRTENLTALVRAETEGRGADVVVVTAPSIEAYKAGLEACRKGGKLCIFAPTAPGEYLQISPKESFFTEIQIIASYSTSHVETREALRLMSSGKLDLKNLITHKYRLMDIAEAFETALRVEESLKTVVVTE